MRSILLGTDWWTDCDDAVALRLLNRAEKTGRIRLVGVGINACMEYSVSSLDAFLCMDGMLHVPIGVDLSATDYGGEPQYQKRLSQSAQRFHSNEEAEDAVKLYRRVLAEANEPVDIVEVGFFQVIVGVLNSPPDEISPLSGMELVKQRVARVWAMAGKWDKDGERENNFCRTPRAACAAEAFCRLCPVPVTFLGWEIGVQVVTGSKLRESDPLYWVLQDHGSGNGRYSWDPMTALLAVIGDENEAGYDVVTGTATADPQTGANYFRRHEDGLHRFVVMKKDPGYYRDCIDEMIG